MASPGCRLTPKKRWLALFRKSASHLFRGGIAQFVALLLVAGGLACSDLKSQTDSFRTLDEARAAGAIEHGWVPDRLPPGTREIRIAHVPGTSRRWGIINFPPGEAAALKALLAPEEIALTGHVVDIPARIEWWPVLLRGSLDDDKVRATGLRAYRSRNDNLVFAINWSQGRAYYWPSG